MTLCYIGSVRPALFSLLLWIAPAGCSLLVSPSEVTDGARPDGPLDLRPADAPLEGAGAESVPLDVAGAEGWLDQAGPDACVPSCAGKTCGASDNCGGSCQSGSCPANETCVAGVCKDCTRWSLPLADKLSRVVVDGDGTAYVVGTSSNQVYLARVDGCGELLASTTHLPAGATSVTTLSLALHGNTVYVVGALVPASGGDPQDGYLGAFTKPSLASVGDVALVGSTSTDEVWDLVAAGGGLWLGGSKDMAGTRESWGLRAPISLGTACSIELGGVGLGRGVNATGGHVYFAGAASGKGLLARYNETDCSAVPCALCQPGWSATFEAGTPYTEFRDLVVSGTLAYVAGYASASATDLYAGVFRVNLTTSKIEATYNWNPTSDYDLFFDIASDGGALYVVGIQGSNTSDPRGTVHRLSSTTLTKTWSIVAGAGDTKAYYSVALTADGGVLLAGGLASGKGILRRCTAAGSCP